MTFGDKIKQLRTEKGWSQEYLANLLGTSKQVLSRYESGQRSPKIETVAEYAEILGLPVSYLVDNNLDALPFSSPTLPLSDEPEEEYLLAARSKDGSRGIEKLTKSEYETAKALIQTLRQNTNPDL